MVDEYISRRALLELYVDGKYDTAEYHVSVPVIIQNINSIPAADVRPVARGMWEEEDSASNIWAFKCSICDGGPVGYKFNFCPNCGAKMEG